MSKKDSISDLLRGKIDFGKVFTKSDGRIDKTALTNFTHKKTMQSKNKIFQKYILKKKFDLEGILSENDNISNFKCTTFFTKNKIAEFQFFPNILEKYEPLFYNDYGILSYYRGRKKGLEETIAVDTELPHDTISALLRAKILEDGEEDTDDKKKYFGELIGTLQQVIDGVTECNIIIAIIPYKTSEFNSILVNKSFSEDKKTIGFRFYSKVLYGDDGGKSICKESSKSSTGGARITTTKKKQTSHKYENEFHIGFLALFKLKDDDNRFSLNLDLSPCNAILKAYLGDAEEDASGVEAVDDEVPGDITPVEEAEKESEEGIDEEELGQQTVEIDEKIPHEEVSIVDTTSKSNQIELCEGLVIPESYFNQGLEKIEIKDFKNEFNSFLLGPKIEGNSSRKLFSYIEGSNKPSRFIGFFREIPGRDTRDLECEIIWEADWENDFIVEDIENTKKPTHSSFVDIGEASEKKTKGKIVKYLERITIIENKVNRPSIYNKEDGPLKVFDVRGGGNSLFYALANSLIHNKNIYDFSTITTDLIEPDFIEIHGNVRPIYKNFANKLRELSSKILLKAFTKLHNDIVANIELYNNVDYPVEDSEEVYKSTMNELINQRINLIQIVEGSSETTIGLETKIHDKIVKYLKNVRERDGLGGAIEFEAICSFFNVGGQIISSAEKSDDTLLKIEKENARVKFPIDDITFTDSIESLEESDNAIFIALDKKHYISLIPFQSLKYTSYNYLFQSDKLSVGISIPGNAGKKEFKISDLHDSASTIYDDDFLEKGHDYIQWLFPIKSDSIYGPSDSQKTIYWPEGKIKKTPNQLTLTDNDIKFIKNDPTKVPLNNLLKSVMIMLRFYGLMITTSDNTEFDGNYSEFKLIEKSFKIVKLTDPIEVDKRFRNLLKKPHNYKRISRIILYLKSVGMAKLGRKIIEKLEYEIIDDTGSLKNNKAIKKSLENHWKKLI